MVKGQEEKGWDSEFMQGKAEWDIIKDFSNEGGGLDKYSLCSLILQNEGKGTFSENNREPVQKK